MYNHTKFLQTSHKIAHDTTVARSFARLTDRVFNSNLRIVENADCNCNFTASSPVVRSCFFTHTCTLCGRIRSNYSKTIDSPISSFEWTSNTSSAYPVNSGKLHSSSGYLQVLSSCSNRHKKFSMSSACRKTGNFKAACKIGWLLYLRSAISQLW